MTGAMRNAFFAAVAVGILAGLIVVSVRALPGDSSSGGTEANPTEESEPTPDPGSPIDTASLFAEAFEAVDIDAIYELVDDDTRHDRSRADIEAVYINFLDEATATSVDVDVTGATERGMDADVTLTTAYFGRIEYAISVPFTRDEDGEHVVRWVPSAVHPELDDGIRALSEVERPSRGAIYDRNGDPLAHTVERQLIGLNRAVIDSRPEVTSALEQFGFSREDIDAAFESNIPRNQRVTVGPIEDYRIEEASQLVREQPGLLLFTHSDRIHPLGPATAHVVGYTRELTAEELELREGSGYRVGDRIGAAGLERTMEPRLAGQAGGEFNLIGQDGEVVTEIESREFVDSEDIHTTLDAAVLESAQEALQDTAGAAVVIDPRTVEILAINSFPSFDPNAFERNDWDAITEMLDVEGNPQANRATGGLYAAGSVFKLVTGAAGLESGLYTPGSTLECGAEWDTFDPPLRNWEGAQGNLTIAEGLMRSCNPVFYEIAYQLHHEAEQNYLSEVARDFGFGAETGATGLDEEAGLVPDAEWKRDLRGEGWFPGDDVLLGIGQGDLLITPIQLANAYTAFVNNRLETPVLIQGEEPEDRGELGISPDNYAHLMQGLELVTGPRGTGAQAFSGYPNFAGKSGTAEDASEVDRALFAALYPVNDPVAVAAVVLDEGESGALEAGPIARDILLAAAN